ncbi:MAG: RagB/SusD family nutrient uptake outer membrane protein, partial [Bacteroidales bacterium]|nr:RagB/SusD family nutrient uptake outer membrane protein [Bacteroidales bacterium]
MKSIKYIVLALSFVAVLSCNKFLDKKPLDKFTDDNFWTSENNVQTFANTFYGQFSGYGNGNSYGVFYFPTLNDNQASNGFTQWSYTNVPASISLWSSGYTELRRANLMIDKIPGIASMSDAAKNNWIGVARLYRALMHYQLVRAFGDIIYVDKVLDVTDEDKELYLY